MACQLMIALISLYPVVSSDNKQGEKKNCVRSDKPKLNQGSYDYE